MGLRVMTWRGWDGSDSRLGGSDANIREMDYEHRG